MTEKLHILLLEDVATDAELSLRELRQEGLRFTAQRVVTEAEFLAALRRPALNLILADYTLPSYDGLSALALAQQERPEVPFLFVSGTLGEETAIDALHRGATDYVLKQRLDRLGPAVQRALHEVEERTRRRQAEEAHRSLVDASLQGLVIFQEGKTVFANQAMARIAGYTIDEMLAMSAEQVRNFVHPEDREIVWQNQRRRLAGESVPDHYEMRGVRKDGLVCWLDLYANRIVYQGHPAIQVAYVDITERKRAEEALNLDRRILEISNRHTLREPVLREVVQEIRDFAGCEAVGIRVLDDHGNIPYEAYVGFRREFYEKESPLSVKTDRCMCINVIKGTTNPALPFYTPGGSFFMNGTTRFLATVSEREKGQTRNVCNEQGYESVALIPIRGDGNILGIIHVADARENRVPRDLVETLERIALLIGVAVQRILTDEALRESQSRLETVFAAIPDVVLEYDVRGRPVRANEAARKAIGLSSREFTRGQVVAKLQLRNLDGSAVRTEDLPTSRALRGETVAGALYSIKTVEGTERVVSTYAAPLYEEGRINGVVALWHDITERKQAEQRLLDYQNRLRELAARLTLAEEQERRRIAVGVHDRIGQRLALLKLAMQSLHASLADPRVRRPMEDLCTEMDHVITETHLLTFELSNPVLYEAGFANAVESWLVEQIHDKHGLPYTFEVEEGLGPLDREVSITLFQIVRELLANVVKHAKAGRVDVHLGNAGDKVQITVCDDGVGFEPARVSRPDSRAGGYGLFSIRERLEYLSGELAIESAPGQGSRIVVTVPMRAPRVRGGKEPSS